jgi:hypothetical protein
MLRITRKSRLSTKWPVQLGQQFVRTPRSPSSIGLCLEHDVVRLIDQVILGDLDLGGDRGLRRSKCRLDLRFR